MSARRIVSLLLTGLVVLGGSLAAEVENRPRYARRLDPPTRNDTFRKPFSVTADLSTGEIFVCDTMKHRVAIFDERGVFRYEIHGGTTFRAPLDIAVDSDGYIFLLAWHDERQAIVRLDFDGRYLGVVDLLGLPEEGVPINPISIALSPSGRRLYVLDPANHWLIIADRDGRVAKTVDLVAGMEPDDAREQTYAHVDAYGDTLLLPRPSLGVVQLFDLDGEPRRPLGQVGLYGTSPRHVAFPRAAAMDDQGNVMILDQRRMMFVLWDPVKNICLDEYYGIGMHPGGLYAPDDLAIDAAGRVYVTQTREGRVQVYEGGRPAARPAKTAAE